MRLDFSLAQRTPNKKKKKKKEHPIKAHEETKARICGNLGVLKRSEELSGGSQRTTVVRGLFDDSQAFHLLSLERHVQLAERSDAPGFKTVPGTGHTPSPVGISPPGRLGVGCGGGGGIGASWHLSAPGVSCPTVTLK